MKILPKTDKPYEDTPQDRQALRWHHHHQSQEPSPNVTERLNKWINLNSTFVGCIYKFDCTLYIRTFQWKTLIIPLGCFELKCTVRNSVAVASSKHDSHCSWEATSKARHQYPQESFLALERSSQNKVPHMWCTGWNSTGSTYRCSFRRSSCRPRHPTVGRWVRSRRAGCRARVATASDSLFCIVGTWPD